MGSNGKRFHRLQKEVDRLTAELGQQDFWLVLEGDWSGQTYLTVPWKMVGRRSRIATLLGEMDLFAWPCNEKKGRAAYIDRKDDVQSEENELGCFSSCSGNRLENDLWLHGEFLSQRRRPCSGSLHPEAVTAGWSARVRKLLDLQPKV